ncbi:hypothetical protein CDG81_10350 [Actinopolyspora erythraea]|uniref:Uncharacterized protein n=1 Tax=Actinopolyspora erythraea TaxID=414996 RepID=A0A099D610_9ACTN|nr:DUF6221 family protein [Actinopolyspora erythraea]ASU78610.1 hypothetical protein CDG81_10350 [Actinopolyspora erythraea]KGI81371.1 hypothetical protein IL38_10360 [Actinopolyspora erythraea]
MDRFREFLRTQILHDLERLTDARRDGESGTNTCSTAHVTRGFRECELKARILDQHRYCGTGHGPCDVLNTSFPHEDERGCLTRALLGLPYNDRPGYHHRWRP